MEVKPIKEIIRLFKNIDSLLSRLEIIGPEKARI